jgi:hypothetical protein
MSMARQWDDGHVSCAKRLEVHQKPPDWEKKMLTLAGGSKTSPIVAYCAAGVRAQVLVLPFPPSRLFMRAVNTLSVRVSCVGLHTSV